VCLKRPKYHVNKPENGQQPNHPCRILASPYALCQTTTVKMNTCDYKKRKPGSHVQGEGEARYGDTKLRVMVASDNKTKNVYDNDK